MPMTVCTFTLNGKSLSTFEIAYYIVDRPTGGLLGAARGWLGNKGDWFALFADDGSVDDTTLCDKTIRGNFRLHPKGPLGRSEGCITIEKLDDFNAIRKELKALPLEAIPDSQLQAYAKVVVK